jgi:Sec-independent protein translocase protein TatA
MMFGIGLSEIAVIALVAIIFIKPEDLPAFFRKAGKFYAKVKKAYDEVNQVKDQVLHEIDEVAKLEDDKPLEAKPATAQEMAPKPATGEAAEAATIAPNASPSQAIAAPAAPAEPSLAQPEPASVSRGLSAARAASPASQGPADESSVEPIQQQ